MNFTILAQDAAPAEGQGAGGILGSPLIMLVAIFVLFYVLAIRPANKQRKEHQARMSAVKKGDKIITNAGIHGLVTYVDDNTVSVNVAEGVTIKMEKAAIAHITKKDSDA